MFLTFLGLFPTLIGFAMQAPAQQQVVRSVVIRNEFVWRVPIRPRLAPQIEWIEKKGPKCVEAGSIAGAMLSSGSSIDFLLRDRRRVRAVMDTDCPALDYYGQFYLTPQDGRICAKREEVRSRIGGSCMIKQFKDLVPKVRG